MNKGTTNLPPFSVLLPMVAVLAILVLNTRMAIGDRPSLISEYRTACDRVESTLKSDKYQNASDRKQQALLHESLFRGIQREEVENAFRAITAADPSERYRILTEGIEKETGQEWQCRGMARIMDQ